MIVIDSVLATPSNKPGPSADHLLGVLRLAGTPTAGKPLTGICDSARCPQATHHPCHRPVWADHADKTKTFLGELGPTRKTEKTRLQSEYDRAQRIVAAIDAAGRGQS
jgi:hypothetical protein